MNALRVKDLEKFGVGSLVLDLDGNVVDANAMASERLRQPVGSNFTDLLTAGSKVYWETAVVPQLLSTGAVEEVLLEFQRGQQPFAAMLSCRRDSAGMYCAFLPHTQRLQFEAAKTAAAVQRALDESELRRLQEVNEFRTRFVNHIAHEFATPLTPLALQLDLLNRRAGPPGSPTSFLRESVAAMKRSVTHLQRIAADVRQAAKIQAGTVGISLMQVDLGTFTTEAVASWRQSAMGADRANLDVTVESIACLLDPRAATVCLHHVLDNALKFSPKGSQILVTVQADAATIQVQDRGRGLAPEFLHELGAPLAKGHPDAEISELGLGLGLYIARNLMAAQKGKLVLTSEGLGRGTKAQLMFHPAP